MSEYGTKVYLFNLTLDNGYSHTLYFDTLNHQKTYFDGIPHKVLTEFSYQRKDSIMRIPLKYDECINYNYVAYQNQDNSDKWFYAFITNYEYKGDDQTNITIETDVIQTWMFDYIVKPSFIEREHVDDDTIGLHTVPENVEIGEYYCHSKVQDINMNDLSIVIGVTQELNGKTKIQQYNGIPSGIIYYAFSTRSSDLETNIEEFIKKYSDAGKLDAITCMFVYPSQLIATIDYDVKDGETNEIKRYKNSVNVTNVPAIYQISIRNLNDDFQYLNLGGTVGGLLDKENLNYITTKPKNNKLLTYPYTYLLVSNNNGGSAIYQWEHFNNGEDIYFTVKGCLTPGGSIRLIPEKYKGVYENDEEGLNLGKFAICNWTGDAFTNWMTQNSVNVGVSTVMGLFQVVAGVGTIATGGGAGVGGTLLMSGVSSIASSVGEIRKASLTPPQAQGNINSGDVITGDRKNKFIFYNMRIKPEYMTIIDEYFSMFGYKVNRVKIPNKNHRENWWFTKTIDVNIDGAIPIKDKAKIKQCYDNGITFWKNPNNFRNYGVSNNIVK